MTSYFKIKKNNNKSINFFFYKKIKIYKLKKKIINNK